MAILTALKKESFFSIMFILVVFSCNQPNRSSNNDFVVLKKAQAQNTILGTLKESMAADYQYNEQVQITDNAYYTAKHKDEILRTLEIVEQDTIPGKNMSIVFYRYSVGADIVRSTCYMRQIDGKWYIHNDYFSSISDDPFKNGRGAEGKALLEKKDKWEEDSKDLWWK